MVFARFFDIIPSLACQSPIFLKALTARRKDIILIDRKIAIKPIAILQTCDLPAILRYRPIFAPHRILPLSPSMRGIKGEGS